MQLVFSVPKIIEYVVQGPTAPQGETTLDFTEVSTPFVNKVDLKRTLPFMGASAIDVDGDGIDEVFVSGGNDQADQILRYNGDSFVQLTGDLGLEKPLGVATMGSASIDATNDGLADLFVARQDGVYFYENTGKNTFDGGKIKFPLHDNSTPLSIALADINKDGAVDLYVSNYIKNKDVEGQTIFNKPYGAYSNLLLNNGDNTFTDITKEAGLFMQHNAFVAVFVDLNNDLQSDLVMAHDTGHVRIFKNNGDNTFTEKNKQTIFSFPMGIAVSDINNDGLQDLYFSNTGTTLPEALVKGDLRSDQTLNLNYMLYENKGDFVFDDVALEKHAAHLGFGWGLVSYDFNNDTRSDYLVAQNYAKFPGADFLQLYPGSLLQQYEDGGFKPVEDVAHIRNPYFGITMVISDFNDDGKPDAVLANLNGPLRAFINEDKSGNHWLKVKLADKPSSIGAIVTVKTASGKTYSNQFYTSEGLASDQTHEIFFGLGKETGVADVSIQYQDGSVKKLKDVAIDSKVEVK